jgi:glycosyltransferase involved in cell wall biosynthesis
MTIGIDARFFGPRGKGLGRYTQKLIEELEEIDDHNDYVIFLRRENFDEFQPHNPRFKRVLADYRWYTLAEQIFLPFSIRRQKIDLMHFPHFNVPIFYFKPFVVTIHDLILRNFATRRSSTLGAIKYWVKNLAYRLVIWRALKRAKKIITVSKYVKNDIIKCFRISPQKIVVTYEGAPEKSLPFPGFDYKLIEFGISKPYLLYVGNAYPHKNLERLVSAFEIIVEELKNDLQLVLVGEEDYFYERLQEEAPVLILQNAKVFEKIVFTDFVKDEDLWTLYQNAVLYVFPSLCEGFGLPPLEAMSHGLAVAVSNVTCLPEILGSAAVYFDPMNPHDMAEKINQVLTDETMQKKLIVQGFEQIKRYSWSRMGEETLKIYSAVS